MKNDQNINRSIADFVIWIEKNKPQSGDVLYRGLSSDEYEPVVSMARFMQKKEGALPSMLDIWRKTNNLIQNARVEGYDRDPTRRGDMPITDLELLAMLQHHGAATPLMDFTYNPLVALWFACQENPPKNGRVIAVNAFTEAAGKGFKEVNVRDYIITIDGVKRKKKKKIKDGGKSPESDAGSEKIEEKIKEITGKESLLWRFIPPGFDARVLAQNSEFIFGKVMLENSDYSFCIIAKDEKAEILENLESLYGISEKTLFRDLHGYAKMHGIPPKLEEGGENITPDGGGGAGPGGNGGGAGGNGGANEAKAKVAAAEYKEQGMKYSQRKLLDDAISNFNRAIELNSVDAETYHNRALAYIEQGKQNLAIADYDKAVELDPDYVVAYYNRGILRNRLGDDVGAMADFNKTIELQPHLIPAYCSRGGVFLKQKDYDRAISDFDYTIAVMPEYEEAYILRGITKIQKKDFPGGRGDLEMGLKFAEKVGNKPLIAFAKNFIDGNFPKLKKS